MAIPLDAAAAALRDAMRETVKRYSLWYLLQGILMIVAGVLALVYPLVASVAVIKLLGWILIISGILQGIGVIGARHVPHFWLELISVCSPSSSVCCYCDSRKRGWSSSACRWSSTSWSRV
jgi:uncharacterized membrane protein HdeD (DUF308 family)